MTTPRHGRGQGPKVTAVATRGTDVFVLETLIVNFLPAPKPFRRKDALGLVWGFFIYLFVGPFDNPERGGGLSFRNLAAIDSRNFIMSSCCSCWISGKNFESPAGFSTKAFKSQYLTPQRLLNSKI